MRKKTFAFILILALILTAAFVCASCVETDKERDVKLAFDAETGVISWYADWATSYELKIYDGDGKLLSDIKLSADSLSMLCNLSGGDYKLEITAFGDGGVSASKELEITVAELLEPGHSDLIIGKDDEFSQQSAIGEPVKILNSAYYYLKSREDDLIIELVDQSGVVSVDAFEMINSSMWEYDGEDNLLKIKPSYLRRFSVGASLRLNIKYADGDTNSFDVKIVDVEPPQVIGGEDGVLEVDAQALNYKVGLGYNGELLKEGSSKILKAVCIDGKKRPSSEYLTNMSQAVITFTHTAAFANLTEGLHYLEIYTDRGKSEVWLDVTNGKTKSPHNVKIDFDSSYPNVFVTWDICKTGADCYIVDIGGKEYSSKEYPNLFVGNSFDATGKINYKDNVTVKAVSDGKQLYGEASKATLDVNISSAIIASYLSYGNSFEFLGKTYNYYISDFDEFFNMIYHALLYYNDLTTSTSATFEVLTFYPDTNAISNVDNSFRQAIDMLNEAVKYMRSTQRQSDGAYSIHLKVQSSFEPNALPDTTERPIEQNKFLDTHYSESGRSADYEGFAVNGFERAASVSLSEELYLALERGVRPEPVVGSSAEAIYDRAKDVLRKIIDDTMTDYQKVHAIYDWLGENVVYDWDITTKMKGISAVSDEYNKFYKYRQFYLEGVFIDGLAVCNGIAKALSVLCGIEGIECYKVKGESGSGLNRSAHAWNKVKVDGCWYVVDATWANRRWESSTLRDGKREVLAHHTLFMSESASGNYSGGAHYESYAGSYSGCYAASEYNVFANTFFTYKSNLYDYVIDSARELEVLIDYYKDKCANNCFITIDVYCNLATLKTYLAGAQYSGCYIELTDYGGAMSGVSSVIIAKR